MTTKLVLQRKVVAVPQVSLLDIRLHLGLATLVGLFLRTWGVADAPPGLNQDEAVYAYDAFSIWKTGRDHLGHPFPFASLETFGDWSSPLLTYLSIPAIAIFGLRVEVIRIVAALIGAAAIPLVFCLGALVLKRPSIGLSAAWAIALLPCAVHLSRWAIIPTVVPTMIAATCLALMWALENRSSRGIVLAALLAALTVASYHSMKVYVPLICVAALVVYWRQLIRIPLEALAYASVLFLAIAGPIFWLSARDPGGGARVAQTSVFNTHDFSFGLMVDQYSAYFSPALWFVRGDQNPMHLPPGQGLLPWALAPLVFAGLIWLAYNVIREPSAPLRRVSYFLTAAIVLYPIPGAFTLPNPHVLRAVHILPLAALAAGIGMGVTIDYIRSESARLRSPTMVRSLVAALFLILVLGAVELSNRYDRYFGEYPREVAEEFHYGMGEALAYVKMIEADYDEVWIRHQNSAYIYVLFYREWDPSDVHRNLVVRRNPPDWNVVESIGRFHFGDAPGFQRQETLFMTYEPSGVPAYEVVAGSSAGGRTLVIEDRRHSP